ncbi:MAG: hypothetical protein NW223_00795 [Hyphomicrobiaceae bacterium]|nr:hypothetical protein [Hyphomicrobiaceae bacterium]
MSDIFRIMAGFLVWLALFSALYGLHGIGCAAGWQATQVAGTSLFRLALVTAAGAAILAQLAVPVALRSPRLRSPSPFVGQVSTTLAVAAVVALTWTSFPVAVLSACE